MSRIHTCDPVLPPLDGSLTIPETLDFQLKHNPNQPFYVFSQDDEKQSLTTITHLEFVRGCHRVAHVLRPNRTGQEGQLVAILALVDSITYQAIVAGMMRAGLVPFPISPRNSPPAIIHLLQKTSCHRLITTEATLHTLLEDIKSELSINSPDYELSVEEAPSLHSVYPKLGKETVDDAFMPYPTPKERPSLAEFTLYLHSSGSTGFPKAIPQSCLILSEWASSFGIRRYSALNPRLRIGAMALPPFHTLGIYCQLLQPLFGVLCSGMYPPVVFTPTSQPFVSTPDSIIDHLRRTACTALMIIPSLLEVWARSEDAIDLLKGFVYIGYSGGPLAKKLGDELTRAGVNIRTIYGGTEFGGVTLMPLQRGHEEDWEYIEFNPHTTIRWVDQGDGTYECQFLTTEIHHPAVENMQDPRGYATDDLFEKHPTREGLWRIIGRKDDVIIHSSGEKTVPTPMEKTMIGSSLIRGVVMFGRKRDRAGVLIEPTPEYAIDPANHMELAELRNKLWPIVEEANKNAPSFSRIFKEMILVASPDKPLPYSPKGTIIRPAALKLYEDDIDALYKTIESTTGGEDVVPPENFEEETVRMWLLMQARDIHPGKNFSPSKDLFEQGFDSLSATFLRLRIVGALRTRSQVLKVVNKASQNMVYTYPTVDLLTNFIVGIANDPEGTGGGGRGAKEAVEEMIERYSQGLDGRLPTIQSQPSSAENCSAAVVLLTGSTGNLGSQILAFLLADKTVYRVYALNRPSKAGGQSLGERHRRRFEDKALDVELLEGEKSGRLVYVEGEAGEEGLGIPRQVYEEIRTKITHIIHTAWRLDFNLTLASFEGNVRGTRHLIDLARSSPHADKIRFVFTSSISSAQGWGREGTDRGAYPEEVVRDVRYALGGGYGEGKYVAERVLESSGLQATSLRIGQVSGGLPNGAWAITDWVPIMVKSSLHETGLGALPRINGVISWLPMDAVCRTILDVTFSQKHVPFALNLVHPRTISWEEVMRHIGDALEGLGLRRPDIVAIGEWVRRLEERAQRATEEDYMNILAIKLLDFFRAMNGADVSGVQDRVAGEGSLDVESGGGNFETCQAETVSKSMRELSRLGKEDAERWVRYWRAVELL